MSNLRKREPPVAPSPCRMRHPGLVMKTLPRLHQEDKNEAAARAARETWWPRVVQRIPVMSCGVWCWQVRPG